ncbi:hypothetical protein BsIDN1_37820 [Bacillus safensis]|uniref:Tryptophan synthase beta chain-like PALP domain-containing protein n=1 Tax=Bacillus safensis TaxID=561879 RepID=A0A5S9MDH1_BACIA|nr:hypothetical protein BsIDN1_37820 [Bacillus safensis]
MELFGKEYVEIILTGDTFDDSYHEAVKCGDEEKREFIHPFDDLDVMAGQGTTAVEILNDIEVEPHFFICKCRRWRSVIWCWYIYQKISHQKPKSLQSNRLAQLHCMPRMRRARL